MAPQNYLTAAVALSTAIFAACASHDTAGNGIGGDVVGTGSGGDGDGTTTPPDNTQPVYPTAHPRIYLTPNRDRLSKALTAGTPAAKRFKAMVDDWMGGDDIWGFETWNAALVGQLTGNTSYCAKAITTVDAQVSAAESAIAAGQAPVVAGDDYLEIGGMVGDLALVYDWCNNQVTSSQKSRWLKYADQAVSNVWNPASAKWGSTSIPWSGWATNDPSDNYYYSFLRATMLLGLASKGEDAQADTWIKQFHDTKIMGQLVPTFTTDLVGGSSREGTGYGVAMRRLFEIYDIWKQTTGENLATKTSHARMSMLAMMHQIVPTIDHVAPTGDLSRDSSSAFYDYHRSYLQELIQMFPGDALSARAKMQLSQSSVPQMGSQDMYVYDFLYDDTDVTAAAMNGNTTYYAPGIGELYTRSGWDSHATWVNMIAGPYTQSHAHQDQGSLMIFKDGWLAYDAVVDSHSGLTQETTAHSLVRIDSGGAPIAQVASTTSKLLALHQSSSYTYAAADLTPAYNGNSAVQKVQREMVFLPPNTIVVLDRIGIASGTTQTWQLAAPVAPSISGSTATISNAGHTLAIQELSGGSMSVTNMTSVDADYASGFRLDETMASGSNNFLHVLSIDGSVSSATATGDASHPGVSLRLANGHTAQVTFGDAGAASLMLDGTAATLAAGVDKLPE